MTAVGTGAERHSIERMKLFLVEAVAIQEELDWIVERGKNGGQVPLERLVRLAERMRSARSRLTATLTEDGP